MSPWQIVLVAVIIILIFGILIGVGAARAGGLADERIDDAIDRRDGPNPNRVRHK